MKNILFSLLLLFVLGVSSNAVEYQVDRTARNTVTFISHAPLEQFEGVTDRIDGYIFWEGDHVPPDQTQWPSCKLYFEVELNGLDTGIGLRNRDMREEYLETDKYPYARFNARLKDLRKVSDALYAAEAVGTFTIHGVDRPVSTTANVIPTASGFRVQCNFEVTLPDYKIKVPKLMFLKLNELIKLQVDFYCIPATKKN
jgi:polyisoprenoid-binding protein YceI